MDESASRGSSEPGSRGTDAVEGLRRLRGASYVGLLGQILIWGSVITLWVVGSLYSNIPISTSIAYGANGLSVSAGAIFFLNILLVAGAGVAAFSLILATRGIRDVSKAQPPISAGDIVALTTIGAIGFGMFALGWAVWLGSFVAPGVVANSDPSHYVPVLAPNLALGVGLLLVVGGLFAFLGMIGIALAGSKVGTTYDESGIELGAALVALPVFSVIGYVLFHIGLFRGERKLERGWVPPPPPPPPPVYSYALPPGGYPAGGLVATPGQPGARDSVVVLLVVVLVLLWVFIVPFAIIASSLTKGPGATPIGNGTPPTAGPSQAGFSSAVLPVLVGLVGTAIVLPLVIVRSRRKRQRVSPPPLHPPPPPPSPPPPTTRDEDPLDHLV